MELSDALQVLLKECNELGVEASADSLLDAAALRRVSKALRLALHPDKNRDKPQDQYAARFARANQALQRLAAAVSARDETRGLGDSWQAELGRLLAWIQEQLDAINAQDGRAAEQSAMAHAEKSLRTMRAWCDKRRRSTAQAPAGGPQLRLSTQDGSTDGPVVEVGFRAWPGDTERLLTSTGHLIDPQDSELMSGSFQGAYQAFPSSLRQLEGLRSELHAQWVIAPGGEGVRLAAGAGGSAQTSLLTAAQLRSSNFCLEVEALRAELLPPQASLEVEAQPGAAQGRQRGAPPAPSQQPQASSCTSGSVEQGCMPAAKRRRVQGDEEEVQQCVSGGAAPRAALEVQPWPDEFTCPITCRDKAGRLVVCVGEPLRVLCGCGCRQSLGCCAFARHAGYSGSVWRKQCQVDGEATGDWLMRHEVQFSSGSYGARPVVSFRRSPAAPSAAQRRRQQSGPQLLPPQQAGMLLGMPPKQRGPTGQQQRAGQRACQQAGQQGGEEAPLPPATVPPSQRQREQQQVPDVIVLDGLPDAPGDESQDQAPSGGSEPGPAAAPVALGLAPAATQDAVTAAVTCRDTAGLLTARLGRPLRVLCGCGCAAEMSCSAFGKHAGYIGNGWKWWCRPDGLKAEAWMEAHGIELGPPVQRNNRLVVALGGQRLALAFL